MLVAREAFRRGLWTDWMMVSTLPFRSWIHRGRRRLHWNLTARPSPAFGPVAQDLEVDLPQTEGVAREWFRVDPPPRGSPEGTFRAAGGRRAPFPSTASRFGDVEDAHAWDRLSWALEPGSERTLAELSRWLDAPLSEQARHPYTVSERICALAQIVGTIGDSLPNEVARKALRRLLDDANRLAHEFETHLGAHNHLLNNARALCAASRLVSDPRKASLWLGRARETWDDLWPKLLLDDGVFGEQSSHYHALLTRTLLDYVRDAREVGRPLPAGMAERARAMCRVTNALMRTDGSLPLFGDISPDLPTSWLRGLPRVCERAGLLDEPVRDSAPGYAAGASAFFRERASESPAAPSAAADQGWQSRFFPSGGLLFAVHPNSSLELAAHGDPRPASACHGDAGRGSFEIWFRGRPIVVDGGMPTYRPGDVRESFRGAAGQNVVSIDDLAPALLQDQARDLPRWYVDSLEGGAWQMDSSGATFTWHGFRRRRPGLTWIRTFRWSGARLDIEDRLEGWTGQARVEARVHFGERGWAHPAHELFTIDGCRARLVAPPDWPIALVEMAHAFDYGVLAEGQGIRMSGPLQLPASWSWSFEFDSED